MSLSFKIRGISVHPVIIACAPFFICSSEIFKCSKCDSLDIDIISGEDLYIEDIEIE